MPDDAIARYVQEQLPLGISPLVHAAWPCPACRGLLTVRRRRFVCGHCGYAEAVPPAIAARLAGQPELALFDQQEEPA
jgi:hypothetical protein